MAMIAILLPSCFICRLCDKRDVTKWYMPSDTVTMETSDTTTIVVDSLIVIPGDLLTAVFDTFVTDTVFVNDRIRIVYKKSGASQSIMCDVSEYKAKIAYNQYMINFYRDRYITKPEIITLKPPKWWIVLITSLIVGLLTATTYLFRKKAPNAQKKETP